MSGFGSGSGFGGGSRSYSTHSTPIATRGPSGGDSRKSGAPSTRDRSQTQSGAKSRSYFVRDSQGNTSVVRPGTSQGGTNRGRSSTLAQELSAISSRRMLENARPSQRDSSSHSSSRTIITADGTPMRVSNNDSQRSAYDSRPLAYTDRTTTGRSRAMTTQGHATGGFTITPPRHSGSVMPTNCTGKHVHFQDAAGRTPEAVTYFEQQSRRGTVTRGVTLHYD